MPYRVRPNCCAAACVLRLSVARRNVSALKASSYLPCWSGYDPLFFAVMTQGIYVLLLSAQLRPTQNRPRQVASDSLFSSWFQPPSSSRIERFGSDCKPAAFLVCKPESKTAYQLLNHAQVTQEALQAPQRRVVTRKLQALGTCWSGMRPS